MKSRRTRVLQLRPTPNLRTAVVCALAGPTFVTEIVAMEQPSYVVGLFGLQSASIACCGLQSCARCVTDAMEERWR